MTSLAATDAPSTAFPNSLEQIGHRVATGSVRPAAPWRMLFLRPALALGMQAMFALVFVLTARSNPWRTAADWWLFWFAMGEVINLWLLRRMARSEGLRLRDIYNIGGRPTWRSDRRWLILGLVVAAPVGYLPSLLIGGLLWGEPQIGADLSFRSIPVAAAWLTLLVFPVIHALTELPTYFGYVMPRLQALSGRRWMPMAACGLVLSTQHVFLPLLFDWRFVVWRLFMFLPFALWLGWVIARRPTTLPYLAIFHGLLDFTLPLFVLLASIR